MCTVLLPLGVNPIAVNKYMNDNADDDDDDDGDDDDNNNIYIAIPLQALRDPEVSRRLRLPDFKTIGT